MTGKNGNMYLLLIWALCNLKSNSKVREPWCSCVDNICVDVDKNYVFCIDILERSGVFAEMLEISYFLDVMLCCWASNF